MKWDILGKKYYYIITGNGPSLWFHTKKIHHSNWDNVSTDVFLFNTYQQAQENFKELYRQTFGDDISPTQFMEIKSKYCNEVEFNI